MHKWRVEVTYFASVAEDVVLSTLREFGFACEETVSHDLDTAYSSWIVTHASAHAMMMFSLKWSNVMEEMQVTEL
jgi:hypothetical protein|tara:strand:- start:1540 stop:1764 length:225 start_codon:yes stop_codon:yes gene_type:complete